MKETRLTPIIRSLLAEELRIHHHLNQTQIAKLLNTTQPAISQYFQKIRGAKKIIKSASMKRVVKEQAAKLVFDGIPVKNAINAVDREVI